MRSESGRHGIVTLCLLAHAFLVVTCRAARNEEAGGEIRKKGLSVPS